MSARDLLPVERVALTLELADLAAEMLALRIHREHPDLSDDEIARRVRAWFLTRPGAEPGDAEGRLVSWPRIR